VNEARGIGVQGGGLAAGGPNLARRPFVNHRPVRRIALLLLAVALVLLLADLWLYVGYARSRRATASELDAIEAKIASEQQALAAAESTLDSAAVDEQNGLVEFLNQRIAERTFGWSVLFDRLAGLLPADVRLVSLAPSFFEPEPAAAVRPRARAAAAAAGDTGQPPREVRLALQGRARRSEAILDLVDALFADPAFADPDLSREAEQGGEVAFSLTVTYLPQVAEQQATPGDDGAEAAGGSSDGDGTDGDGDGGDGDGGSNPGGAADGTTAGGAA